MAEPEESLEARTCQLIREFDAEDKGYAFDDAGDGTMYAEKFSALLREWLDGPAPVIGYLIDGKLWHPSDVTIVRQGAAQAAEDRPPRITVRHHFTPAHAVQATADSHG